MHLIIRNGWRATATGALLVLAAAALLFGATSASAAAPSVTAHPSTGLADGQSVTVTASGFKPKYFPLVLVECAKSATGASGCDTNDVAFGTTDANGSVSKSLTVRAKFGSTDCTKVECIVQAHEGTSASSGSTATSGQLVFGAARAEATSPAPTHAPSTRASQPASSTGAGLPASAPTEISTSSGTAVPGQSSQPDGTAPTGADTGLGITGSAAGRTGLLAGLAAVALIAGLVLHRRRQPSDRG